MKDRNCIRVLADENQINQCKHDVAGVEDKILQMADLLSLAGNAVRLKILFLLYKEGQMCPCDLSDVLGMTVPAISQHLRKLKDRVLVKDKKVGQTIFYSLVEENVQLILPLLKELTVASNKQKVK
ncbi:MAG: metalloregulator ArsR/SmtB family transcription factor [Fulvivirga sp.]